MDDMTHLPALISESFGTSRSEARRLIATGGVKLNDAVVTELDLPTTQVAGTLRVGRRRYAVVEIQHG